jgi:hypothetical protein
LKLSKGALRLRVKARDRDLGGYQHLERLPRSSFCCVGVVPEDAAQNHILYVVLVILCVLMAPQEPLKFIYTEF